MRPTDPTVPPPSRSTLPSGSTGSGKRPAPPTRSAALLDALWARASAELDRIEAAGRSDQQPLVMPIGSRGSQRRRIITWVALAQAAAILIAVGVAC